MANQKLRNIAKVMKEITVSKSQSDYDISGLDLGLCKFFYRTPQQLFQDLSNGDYSIEKDSNNQTLKIINNELLKNMESIQVCYILDLTSSKYETDFNVDINQLNSNYNKLVDDVHVLWEYVKKVGIIADDTSIPLILPQLNTDEIWVKTDDGYKGVSLTDAEGIIKETIEEYTSEMEARLDRYVENPLKPRLDEYTSEKETELKELVKKISDNIAVQIHEYKLPIGQKTIVLPEEWIVSDRLNIHVNGLLLTKEDDYTISDKTITLDQSYQEIADVYVSDMLPVTYTEQIREEFMQLVEDSKEDITTLTNDSKEDITNLSKESQKQITTVTTESKNDISKLSSEKKIEIENQGNTSKQLVVEQTTTSINEINSTTNANKEVLNQYVQNTSFKEIDNYVEENKENLKGEAGPQGPQGIQGDSGVYVGSEQPSGSKYKVWIDPQGGLDMTALVPVFSIGDVDKLPSDNDPTVTITGTNKNPILNFGIPVGGSGGGSGGTSITDVIVNVDDGVGTPSCEASISGTTLTLDFKNLKGQQGVQGNIGPQGPKGDVGPQGPIGETGPKGEQGLQGPAGQNGTNGKDGQSAFNEEGQIVFPNGAIIIGVR